MSLNPLIQHRREDILRLAKKHGARNVRVFGSMARGETTPESDVDLLVDATSETTAFFPAGLIVDLQDLLGRDVQVLTENALHWYIRDRVLDEAKPL